MSKVVVTNITEIPQTVIDIEKNIPVTINPDTDYTIENQYNPNHGMIYASYSKKGLKVEFIDDSKDTIPVITVDKKTNEIATEEVAKEEVPAEKEPEFVESSEKVETESKEEVTPEEPKKKSRRAKKETDEAGE